MTWIKICGITNLEDALVAVQAGADALGFVFYEKSPRKVDAPQVRKIVSQLPEGVEKVGVFVNQHEDVIRETADQAGLTAVQMHGDHEDPHVADLLAGERPLKVLAVISMRLRDPQSWAMMWNPDQVYAFLADSGTPTMHGGTGKTFDWHASVGILNAIKKLGHVVLAGGLCSANVATAMEITKPWGVDVSSGVESRPGKKDPAKVRAFIKSVRDADKEILEK